MSYKILPPPANSNVRWTPGRKKVVAHMVMDKRLSFDDAKRLWDVSADELAEWIKREIEGRPQHVKPSNTRAYKRALEAVSQMKLEIVRQA